MRIHLGIAGLHVRGLPLMRYSPAEVALPGQSESTPKVVVRIGSAGVDVRGPPALLHDLVQLALPAEDPSQVVRVGIAGLDGERPAGMGDGFSETPGRRTHAGRWR